MLADNLRAVRERIREAAARRREKKLTGDSVTLVAVTKNHPPATLAEALALGVTDIGENRVQEARHKKELVTVGGRWHLIGHLQSNKVRQAVALFDVIESIDSARLLAAVDAEAARIGKIQEVLLQLNIAGEEQKSGFAREDYLALQPALGEYRNVRVRGLMVIAPLCDDMEATRPVFAAGYRCFERLQALYPQVDCLSMGMSGDYAVAIEEGANSVRVGTALFGERDYTLKF